MHAIVPFVLENIASCKQIKIPFQWKNDFSKKWQDKLFVVVVVVCRLWPRRSSSHWITMTSTCLMWLESTLKSWVRCMPPELYCSSAKMAPWPLSQLSSLCHLQKQEGTRSAACSPHRSQISLRQTNSGNLPKPMSCLMILLTMKSLATGKYASWVLHIITYTTKSWWWSGLDSIEFSSSLYRTRV